MTTTLYVGNLPWQISEQELTRALQPHAQVEACRIITDRMTGRSRGFGFVEVADPDADRVVEAVNGIVVSGRALTVNLAQNRQH